MSHPESEHGLRVQLATALRERDEARAFANGEVAHLTTLRAKQDAELVSTRESLAAARRECDALRKRFEKVAEFHEEQLRLLDSEPAKEWAGSDKTGYYAAWKTAHTVAAHEAREALAGQDSK